MNKKKILKLVRYNLFPLILFFAVLILYIHNLSRATYAGDVGDFLSASIVMGVPHAPGYPLFTIFGFILSRINLITPAFMIGLISAFSGAFAVLFYYLLSYSLTKDKFVSLISSLILAFSYYFWFYNEVAEVFALNNFFAVLLFFLAFLYSRNKDKRYLFALSFFTGLSLTNHQTILLIFPSLLILIGQNLFKEIRNWKLFAYSIFFFLLGFVPYIYVPIASSTHPPINWDNVRDLNSFIHLILRKDYGTFNIGIVATPAVAQRFVSFKVYFFNIATQATISVFLISILGALYSLKKYKSIFLSVLLAFILTGPFFITFAGFPLYSSFNVGVYERFLILSFVILLIFFPLGLLFLKNIFSKFFPKKAYSFLFLLVFLIIPFSLFRFNYPKTNLSQFYVGDNLAYDLLASLPKNSVIFLSGDTVMFNTWYIHYGKNFRPDVQVVNLSGLTDNTFFKNQEDKYLKEHPKEKGNLDVTVSVVKEIAKTREVFSSLSMQPIKGEKINWVPYGLVSRIYQTGYLPTKEDYEKEMRALWKTFHIPYRDNSNNFALGNLLTSEIPLAYSSALTRTGTYVFRQFNDTNEALYYYQKALEVDNGNPAAFQVFAIYYIEQKSCRLAKINLDRAMDINPYDPLNYFFLYYTYTDCYNDKQAAKNIEDSYNKTFQSNFRKDLKKTIDTKSF